LVRGSKMKNKFNEMAMGYSAALVGAISMLVLGIFGNLGMYTGAVSMMQQWHMFFTLSVIGIIGGMIEAAIISYVIVYLFAVFYNRLK
jgi:hypothetical protein